VSVSGKVVIVTGGAMGIGYAIAEALAARGASVVVADRANAAAAAARIEAGGHAALAVTADVSAERDVEAMVAAAVGRFGRVDALVNNAGIYSSLVLTPFEELSVEEWRRVLEVNVIGVFLCCRAVLSAFKRQGGGRIVNISSGVAFKGNPDMLHYVASKGAVVSMTRSLASELGRHGVLVNSVAPGLTLSAGLLGNQALMGGVKDFAVRTRAVKREMYPADLVGAVAFFLGADAAFITGQTLVVDGGAYYH
jgi:NAD(P)-dependent dehydrogenase (short-subunit alcohol dehydrogenase family)